MQPRLRFRNPDGSIFEIGPEHPDYERLLAEAGGDPGPRPLVMLGIGVAGIAGSLLIFYLQYLSMKHWQKYSVKLQFLAGLLLVFALFSVCYGVMASIHGKEQSKKDLSKGQLAILISMIVGCLAVGIYASLWIHNASLSSLGYQ
jgi:hypothetical protein